MLHHRRAHRAHRAHRRLRPSRLLTLAILTVPALVLAPVAAPGQAAPPPPTGPPAASGPAASPTEWLPLRRNVDGSEVKIGCTFNSRGSQFGYSCGGHHSRWALDLIAQTGTPVYAVRAGFATDGTGKRGGSGYGNVVRIDHGDGTETLYAHLSKVLVPAGGALVSENTVIGLVGSTGSSSTPHLHYEKRVAGRQAPVDPGPLSACSSGKQVRYPQVAGRDSWYAIPWGAFTLASDGTTCGRPGARLQASLPVGALLLAMLRVAGTSAGT